MYMGDPGFDDCWCYCSSDCESVEGHWIVDVMPAAEGALLVIVVVVANFVFINDIVASSLPR
jgi:hypothetical protein